MNYLYKFHFFDPAKSETKRDIFITSSAIDFFTNHKQPGTNAEGTRLQTNIPIQHISADDKYSIERYSFISHIVEGIPELCNQIAFDGLFCKSTIQYLKDGTTKKYTSWLNPNNICSLYSLQPDCVECFFFSGTQILISGKYADVMQSLKTHNQKYKERKAQKNGTFKKS